MAELPLFPLSTVLMPGAPLPLHIFEPRYRQLTVDLVTGTVPDKQFGVVAVREGWTAGDDTASLHRVGCTAELLDVRRLPDGRFDVVTRGSRRFRLLAVEADARPYLMATVEFLPDRRHDGSPGDLSALADAARAAHRRYCTTAWTSGDWSAPADDVAPQELAHLLAADCLLPMSDRQRLLEQPCPEIRLRMVRGLLVREAGLLDRLRAVPAPSQTFTVEQSPN